MQRVCVQCGKSFEAKTARFCSGKCRTYSSRGIAPAVAEIRPRVAADVGGLSAQVRLELEESGRLQTYLGQAAVQLAQRIDEATAVMGYAALVKELRSVMGAALAGVAKAADPVDEIKAARDRKLAAVS